MMLAAGFADDGELPAEGLVARLHKADVNAARQMRRGLLTAQPRSANILRCLVRPKHQFFLTRAALSTCGRAKSKFLSGAINRGIGSGSADGSAGAFSSK